MRTMLLAAAAALSIGTVAAHADGGGFATTHFTMIQDQLAGTAKQVQVQPQAMMDQPRVQTNAAQSQSLGTWLFAPSQGNS